MILSTIAILSLATQCGPKVAPETVAAIIAVESGGNPKAIHRNNNGTTDYGLMQVNSGNAARYHVRSADLLNPCINIRIGTEILAASYWPAAERIGHGQDALRVALSSYNTGDPHKGFINGYVDKVYGNRNRRFAKVTRTPAAEPATIYTANSRVFQRHARD
jgi:type IV secretion system protein VirB1